MNFMTFKLHLKPGQELSNEDVCSIFHCGNQGGMRRSNKTNSLVIISDHTKGYYRDEWDKDKKIFYYTGMGKMGNQSLTFAQNKTLNESNTNGIEVYLFEVFEKGKYVYQGKAKLSDTPFQEKQPDFENNNRNVWIFPLKLINRKLPELIPEEVFEKIQNQREKQSKKLTENELLKRIELTVSKPIKQKTTSDRFMRSEYISEYVKRKANGKCQLCKQNAPFNDQDNSPYL
jgi:5-methylcytosine-specific restriction enzyme A